MIKKFAVSGLKYIKKRYFTWQMSKFHRQPPGSNKVLFWVPGGMPLMLHVEGATAVALRLRGIDVHAVICDGPFRACIKREITDNIPISNWHKACAKCKADNSSVLDMMGVKYSYIGDFVPEDVRAGLWEKTKSIDWKCLDGLYYDDVNIGKNVRSAIMRYLRGNSLTGHEAIVREYAFSALVVAAAISSALEKISPRRIFMSHGIYVDWGPALQIAMFRKIPVTGWMGSYLTARFYFKHVEDNIRIDFHTLSRGAWEDCKNTALSLPQESRLEKFLENRYSRQIAFDMRNFKKFNGGIDSLRKKLDLLSWKPVWGVLCHVNWDCVSDASPMAYENFNDWILDTVKEIINITDVQWIVKIHPSEALDNPESGIQKLMLKNFPSLPPHVKLLPFDAEINPFDFFQLIDGGVTVYGTAGLELAMLGRPVILAGEAHYGGRGFTYEGLSPDIYKQLLRTAATLKQLSAEQRLLARKYAYCYFMQRQIPLPVVKETKSTWWKFQFKKRNLLLPGRDVFLDLVCERIIDGKDFIMDETLVKLSETF